MRTSPNQQRHFGVLFVLTVCAVSAAWAGFYNSQPVASASTSRETTVPRRVFVNNALPPASTIVVNSTADVENNSDGLCTLREAITAANTDTASGPAVGECAAGSGDDTITITVSGTITLPTALPDLSTSMSINGPGASLLTVQRSTAVGTPNFRIFAIVFGRTASISGVTLSNGNATTGLAPNNSGGAILNNGTLILTNSTVSGNNANPGGGGGIFSNGTLTVANCTISGNSSTQWGGGIYVVSPSSGTGLTIINSTISGNSTAGEGGGVMSFNASTSVTNITVTNNRSDSDNAGGEGGGGISASGGLFTLKNSVVAGNFRGASGTTASDIRNSFTITPASSFNLIGTGGSGGLVNGTNGNQVGVANPFLGPLTNNGGLTMTHALLPGSPAIDSGSDAAITNPPFSGPPFTDQRGAGFNRFSDGNGDGIATVDIGAYEFQGILVTNTNDSGAGSLRQAIIDANTSPDTNAINFQAGLTGTITLLTALPDLSTSMSINGPGANLLSVVRSSTGGTPSFRIFTVQSSSTVNISGLTVASGSPAGLGNQVGGNVFNNGTLTLNNCTVSGGAAAPSVGTGGGIFNNTGATLTLTNSNVSGNSAVGGAGILNGGTLSITNSSLSGNVAGISGGGAIYNNGPLTVTNSTISGNFGGGGAGIFNGSSGIVTVTNSTVSGNLGNGGSGIFNGGTFTLTNVTVSGNLSPTLAGGIYNGAGALTLTNVTVTNNRSDSNNSGGETGGGIYWGGGTVTLRNAIVAGNFRGTGTTADDISGSIDSTSSFNLVGTCSGCGLANGINNNQIGVSNPGLGSLANNGGPRLTHLPLPGSPAINAGSNALLPADTFDLDGDSNTAEPLPVDQRGPGFNRIVNTTVDIGAVEVNYTITATGGTPQSTTITSAFSTLLQATVTESGNNQSGIPVTFTPPASGASGSFSGSATVNTDASGIATAPIFTANRTAGGPYNLVASLAGGAPSANFSLTNTKAPTTISVFSSVNPSEFGQTVTFTAAVGSNVDVPTGTVQFKDGVTNLGSPVNCAILPPNACFAEFSTSTLSVGVHSISATYSGDANFLSSSGTMSGEQVVKVQPTLSIDDVSITEGNSGTANLTFTVTLSAASNLTVSAGFSTANGTATTTDGDYQSTSNTLQFNPGDLTKTITVSVTGDQKTEPGETVFVVLSNPVNAAFSDSQGQGTILNDDNLLLLLDTSGPDANQLAALDALLLVRDPFRVLNQAPWFSSDQNTRVILFALNLQLTSGDGASDVKVILVDGNNQPYEVPADDVRSIAGTTFTQVTFKLPNALEQGTCLVSIKVHERISNTGTFRIAP